MELSYQWGGGGWAGGPTIFLYISRQYIFAKSWSSCIEQKCTLKMYKTSEISRTYVLNANYAIT